MRKSETKSSVKNNFFVFFPVSIVFCRGIRVSLIMVVKCCRVPQLNSSEITSFHFLFVTIEFEIVITQNIDIVKVAMTCGCQAFIFLN